ncbi:MAG: LacI family DNA-binding transcriptional regulator [Pseudomonadota bacterium]
MGIELESASKSPSLGRVTLEDVAHLAKVSPATVSRCLNRPESVNLDKRARVNQAIQTLGYVPHGAARALASKQSRMVGAVFPAIDNTLFGTSLDAFQRTMADADYTVIVASSDYDPVREKQHVRRMLQSGIDALMLVGLARDEETYELISAHAIPYVTVWRLSGEQLHPAVGFDNRAAAEHLTGYLFSLGHERIGVLSGILEHNDRAQDRLAGVRDAYAKQGRTLADNDLIERPFGVEQGREMLRLIMSQETPPTAVVCGAEPLAYGAIFEAAAQNIDVPGDLSVAAFDDTWLAGQISPKLTTVRTPNMEIGEEAAKYLIATLSGVQPPLPRPLETDLIIRESTGRPPAG